MSPAARPRGGAHAVSGLLELAKISAAAGRVAPSSAPNPTVSVLGRLMALPRTGASSAPCSPLYSEPPKTSLTGVAVGRDGKVRCPFHHDDRAPSLHVYEDPDRGWYCFGCGRGGSIYDFAAALLDRGTRGEEFIALRRELAAILG